MYLTNFNLYILFHLISGNVNDHLLSFEQSISEETHDDVDELAKTMLVFMVRGLFSRLRFPYAQFPSLSLTGDLLFNPFWQAVYRLERMEFKVWLLVKVYFFYCICAFDKFLFIV